jgi:hypothetical protein
MRTNLLLMFSCAGVGYVVGVWTALAVCWRSEVNIGTGPNPRRIPNQNPTRRSWLGRARSTFRIWLWPWWGAYRQIEDE